ncbi:MAG: LacI family transcriptional regulator [Anaerolineaceae bacterium]|nr:MAG: LacI family transcriptional regulator [Anaerolineaceae bacterium]
MSAKPTIYDVAEEAGVGIGTVSRVLNNSTNVSERSRLRVQQAIRKLGFKPSSAARKLSRQTRIHNLGVITQSFNSYYSFAERLRGVQAFLSEQDEKYELILYNASSRDNAAEQLKAIIRDAAVEGLMIIDIDLSAEEQKALRQANIPYIGVNNSTASLSPNIGADNHEGARLATQYLIDNGHRHIAYIGDFFVDERFGFTTSHERYNGYRTALETNGFAHNEDFVKLGEHGYDAAHQSTLELIALPHRPTAIFAMSDTQALGCMAALRQCGLDVPADVSVMGYDDLEISKHTGLTTVRQHLELSGRRGAAYLLHTLKRTTSDVNLTLPQPVVIPRQTTRDIG